MTYTLNYKDNFNEIKSMNTATNIDLVLSKDGLPYNLANISDNTITVKIANENGFIKDLLINISDYTNEEKSNGTFTLELDDNFMQSFPPDIYYLEVWINTPNNNRIIFPSNDEILPFTINSNIVNGSNAIPMITFYQVKQDVESTKKLVFEHEAKIEKYISSLDSKKDNVINDINSKIQGYYDFSNNIKTTLNSLNGKVFNEADDLNGKINNISNNVSEATSAVTNAGNNVKSSVENIVNSAKNNINHDINTNSAINLINSGAAHADAQIDNVVGSAKNKLVGTASNLRGQLSSLTDKGIKQINVTAGSAANHLTDISRSVTTTGDATVKNITSTANSANYDVKTNVSSFNGYINGATNSLANYTSDTQNNYSDLNNHINQISSTISDDANSAYSHINSLRDTNTSQIVSNAVDDFHKATGTNDTIPKSLEALSKTDDNLSEAVNSNTNLITSYRNNYQDSYDMNHTLISNLSASVMFNQNNINSLNSSNNTLSQSVSSLTNESLITDSNLSSTYNKCLTQANSYTNDKMNKSSNNNSEIQKMHDYNAGNLVPLNIINKGPILVGTYYHGVSIEIPVIKGKTYWISCYIKYVSAEGVTVYSDWIMDDENLPVDLNITSTYSGQMLKTKITAPRDGYMPLIIGQYDHVKLSKLCVTQSENYVPFEVAEDNRIGNSGTDLFKPNLLPVTSYSDKFSNNSYRIFSIPVIKGKSYWFSSKGGDLMRVYSPKNGNMNNVLTDDYDGDLYDNGMIYAFHWISDRNGILRFGFSNISNGEKYTLTKTCVTQTDKYIPFELAQENRETIQAVFNTTLNNNDSNTNK